MEKSVDGPHWLVKTAKSVVLPLAICFLLEILYRDALWQKTLEDTPVMQKKTKMLPFFRTISDFGKGEILVGIYAVLFNVMSKPAALYFACSIALTNFLMNELKSIYALPRPYWVEPSITSFNTCHTGFGNPSGHMINNTFLWYSIYLHFYADIGVKAKKMSVFCTAYIIKMAATSVVMTYLIFIGFGRVYLGAHSYNQVLFGAMLGIVLAYVCHYNLKPFFYQLPTKLFENNSNEGGQSYAIRLMDYAFVKLLWLVIPIGFGIFVLQMRLSDDYQWATDKVWVQRMKDEGCEDLFGNAEYLSHRHFLHTGIIAASFGAIVGQLCEW